MKIGLQSVFRLTPILKKTILQAAPVPVEAIIAYILSDTGNVIFKIDLANMTQLASMVFDSDTEHVDGPCAVAIAGSKLFFATFDPWPSKMYKINLAPFTPEASFTLDTDESAIFAGVTDLQKDNFYLGTENAPGKIIKINLPDFVRLGVIDLEENEFRLNTAFADAEHVYFCTGGSPVLIVKIRISNFTRVGALSLNPGENWAFSSAIDPQGIYAYVGLWDGDAEVYDYGKIVKIRLSDFTRVGFLNFGPGGCRPNILLMDKLGNFMYAGLDSIGTDPGKIIKIRSSDFSVVDTLNLDDGEPGIICGMISDSHAYFLPYVSPIKVIKIDLTTFTRIGDLTLEGDFYPASGIIA